jgi:hypothetical protein
MQDTDRERERQKTEREKRRNVVRKDGRKEEQHK